MPHPQFDAWAPAYGVRATLAGRFVRLHVQDSGGRGYPHVVMIVPVEQQGQRLRIVQAPGQSARGLDAETMKDFCWQSNPPDEKTKRQTASPYLFKIPVEMWPKDAPLLLVLLLYVQAHGVGGIPRPPRTSRYEDRPSGGSPHDDEALLRAMVAEAVAHALAHDTFEELRGGLLVGPSRSSSKVLLHDARDLTFAVASCLYPSDILDRMPDDEHATHGPADASLLALGDLLADTGQATVAVSERNSGTGRPTLLLLIGDQVYTDATGGLFDPKLADERFRLPYERRAQSRGVRSVTQRLGVRVEMVLDDHEIRDNWAPNDPEPVNRDDPSRAVRGAAGNGAGNRRRTESTVELGKHAYFKYQRGLQRDPKHVWHSFIHDGFPFFIGDTRTERCGRDALSWHAARIMKDPQFGTLCHWMADHKHRGLPKFVITSSALLPRHVAVAEHPAAALYSEGWDGFPSSLHSLLSFACEAEIKGLVFLSGDDHMSNVSAAVVTRKDNAKRCRLYSIHSSALYAPYPFANSVPEEFKARDFFQFSDQEGCAEYTCRVETRFFPGDGFAVIDAHRKAGWNTSVRFYDSRGAEKSGAVELELGL